MSANKKLLNDNMYLVFTGKQRSAFAVEEAKFKTPNVHVLEGIKQIADAGELALKKDRIDLKELGDLLSENWRLKRALAAEVTTTTIDHFYDEIMRCGAYGAKLCGAGGGGFFFVLASPAAAKRIKLRMTNMNFATLKIEEAGARIVKI